MFHLHHFHNLWLLELRRNALAVIRQTCGDEVHESPYRILSGPAHSCVQLISCKYAWDSLGIELVAEGIFPGRRWLEKYQRTKWDLFPSEGIIVHSSPRAIAFYFFHVEQVRRARYSLWPIARRETGRQ